MSYRRDKHWYTDVSYRIGNKRNRIRRKAGTRKKDADAAEARIRASILDGTFVPEGERAAPELVTFAEFALGQFLPWSEMHHSDSHNTRMQSIIRKRLIPLFGDRHLGDIKRVEVESYATQRCKKGLGRGTQRISPATVNRELMCLSAIYKKAMDWEVVEVSPVARVKLYKEPLVAPAILSKAQVRALLEHIPDHLRALVGVAAYAGLRQTELFQLRWEHVDLQNMVLTVTPGEGRKVKSGKPRTIPINSDLYPLLRRHPQVLGNKLVFPSPRSGKQYQTVDHSLHKAGEAAGIGKVGLHQLRHTFCSHSFMAGTDAVTIQGLMGHENILTTMRYAHVTPDHVREAMERLSYDEGS